ncbi:MAG: hypothetical protein JRN17_05470 [Nitrososphaerota archaeon]|nr:hypothetical protein [Nitrososphaerota archaeon]
MQNDYYGLPFNVNPAPPATTVPLILTYPPYTINPQTGICATLNIELEANGTLAQGVPVKVGAASGLVTSTACGNIQSIFVLIDGAAVVGQTITNVQVYGLSGAEVEAFLNLNFGSNIGNLSASRMAPLDFPVAGTYSPTLVVITADGTYPNATYKTTVYTYSDFKIPVASALDIQNAKNTRIETALSYIIVVFVFVEGFATVLDHTKGESQSGRAPPTAAVISPERNSPSLTNPVE